MLRPISGSEFLVWFVGTILYLASLVFLFPYFLQYAVESLAGDCAGGGECGALATVLGIYVKFPLVLIGIALIALSAFKRIRAQFSRLWILLAVAIGFVSAPQIYALGNFWGANFSVGILGLSAPFPLLALLVFGILFCIEIEDAPGYQGSLIGVSGPLGLPSGKIYAATAIWLLVCAAVSFLATYGALLGPAPLVIMLFKPLYLVGGSWILDTRIPSLLNGLSGILLIVGLLSGGSESGAGAERPRPRTPRQAGGPSPSQSDRPAFGRRKT
ncbi:MAG: hypothetical protein CL534_18395 [Ahrensia sp.]|nr:hypothetical protein [Ahrensia sp.]